MARPLHLCYEGEPEALAAYERFAEEISQTPDCGLVTIVQDPQRRVAFLKRDFRSIELWRNEDDGNGGLGDDGEPHQAEPLPLFAPNPPQAPAPRRSLSALEAALNDIIPSCALRPR